MAEVETDKSPPPITPIKLEKNCQKQPYPILESDQKENKLRSTHPYKI